MVVVVAVLVQSAVADLERLKRIYGAAGTPHETKLPTREVKILNWSPSHKKPANAGDVLLQSSIRGRAAGTGELISRSAR